MDPLINWLIAQNPSLLPQSPPVAAVRVGGLRQHSPRRHLIHPFFCSSSAEREA